MNLDNKPFAGNIRLFYMAIPFLVVVTTALLFLVFNIKDFKWAIILGIFLILFFIIMAILKFYFISFYAGPDKIRLRYKSLSPFPTQNNSIQINSNEFYDYKIETSFFEKKHSIILMIETPGGIAEFSKVSLMSLSKDEIKQITKALDLIILMNKEKK